MYFLAHLLKAHFSSSCFDLLYYVICHQLNVLTCLFTPRQLILIIELYSHYDVYDYLRQIALTLCSDKVSEVRWISYKLVSLQQAV